METGCGVLIKVFGSLDLDLLYDLVDYVLWEFGDVMDNPEHGFWIFFFNFCFQFFSRKIDTLNYLLFFTFYLFYFNFFFSLSPRLGDEKIEENTSKESLTGACGPNCFCYFI